MDRWTRAVYTQEILGERMIREEFEQFGQFGIQKGETERWGWDKVGNFSLNRAKFQTT